MSYLPSNIPGMNTLPLDSKVSVVSALVEGNSIRSTERMLKIHRDTIMRLGVEVGRGCEAMHNEMVRGLWSSQVEIDEIWCFVGKKQKRVQPTDCQDFGDAYTFTAIDAHSKLCVSYLTDKRTWNAACRFLMDMRARIQGRPQISSDAFTPYTDAVERAFGSEVDYAQLMKEYGTEGGGDDAAHRYSPGRIKHLDKWPVQGNPDMTKASTSYVERQNLTMRMAMRRFTRLTNGFSKKLENLRAAVSLHFGWYNFCRPHETIRVTPAMEAGLTDHVWSIGELVAVALGVADMPTPLTVTPRAVTLRVIQGGK